MPPLRETILFYVAIESRRCCISDLKLRGLITVHAVAHGDNGVEVVNVGIVHLSIGGSYPNFSEN